MGKETFWALNKHAIIKELGYEPPRAEIHTFKAEHEKMCADVFVTLALTGKLYDWEAHRKLFKDTIPDRTADYGGTVYIEVESGKQDKIREKAENYKRYFQETKEQFQVWFLVATQARYESGLEDLRDYPQAYSIQLLSEFHDYFRSDTQSDSGQKDTTGAEA